MVRVRVRLRLRVRVRVRVSERRVHRRSAAVLRSKVQRGLACLSKGRPEQGLAAPQRHPTAPSKRAVGPSGPRPEEPVLAALTSGVAVRVLGIHVARGDGAQKRHDLGVAGLRRRHQRREAY